MKLVCIPLVLSVYSKVQYIYIHPHPPPPPPRFKVKINLHTLHKGDTNMVSGTLLRVLGLFINHAGHTMAQMPILRIEIKCIAVLISHIIFS